jgi:hypothetical protein
MSVSELELDPDSQVFTFVTFVTIVCPDGVIGSHARLKILWPQGRAGSIPALGTKA